MNKNEMHAKVMLHLMKDMDKMIPVQFELEMSLLNYIMTKHYDHDTAEINMKELYEYFDDLLHHIRVALLDFAEEEVK